MSWIWRRDTGSTHCNYSLETRLLPNEVKKSLSRPAIGAKKNFFMRLISADRSLGSRLGKTLQTQNATVYSLFAGGAGLALAGPGARGGGSESATISWPSRPPAMVITMNWRPLIM